mmetsp:Transcript_36361/g.116642  ORF Transcript_36361/g.116642 Transcript_36361/m.116642 type:complete len:270 (+) Transcript_36361:85-894(+)
MAPRHGSGRRDGAAAVACLNSSSNTSCGSLVALGMRHPATPLLGGSSCSPAPPGRCCSSPCLPAASPMAPCSRSRCVASATALPRITDPHAAANAMSPASSLLIRAAHPAAAAGAHRDSSRTVVFSLTVGARMALERVYPTKQAKGFQLTWTGNGGRDLESAFVKGCAAAEDLLLLTPSQGHVSKAPVWRRTHSVQARNSPFPRAEAFLRSWDSPGCRTTGRNCCCCRGLARCCRGFCPCRWHRPGNFLYWDLLKLLSQCQHQDLQPYA